MKGLRLTELYSSVQGEGPRTGEPTIFVRFGGCNMRCAGWPCDTPHAIFPELWKNDPIVDADHILKEIHDMPGKNVCITGGEPTMQMEEELERLGTELILRGYTIDVFTNGSLKPLPLWMTMEPVVMIMLDWKLAGSGEAQRGVDIRIANARRLTPKDGIKFVIAKDIDLDAAMYLWKSLELNCQTWVGAAWNQYDPARLVRRVQENNLPWRINIQIHKYIFPGQERGI